MHHQHLLPRVQAVENEREPLGSARDQTCACPPSTKNSIPLTKLASSEAKNTAAEAISAGSAIRPSGTADAKLARTSSGLPGMNRNRPGVLVGPGLSALTRMPRP